jgi:hypothetical protein
MKGQNRLGDGKCKTSVRQKICIANFRQDSTIRSRTTKGQENKKQHNKNRNL